MPVITPINIHVGRGDVWIGVDVPDSGQPVPLDANGAPSTGRNIGATLAPSNWIYRPTPFEIRTQQNTGIVGYVITEEDLRIDFEVGEVTYQNLKDMLVTPRDQGTFVSVGGNIVPPLQSCLLVAPRRAGGYIEAMVYLAAFLEARELVFNRAGQISIRVAARGQAVTSRPYGDQLGFLHPAVTIT
jgi:hypothetical protein